MTAIAEAPEDPDTAVRLADGRVRCACGAVVKPTRTGGSRPRPHLRWADTTDPAYNPGDARARCTIVHATETLCKRCGGTAHQPLGVWRTRRTGRKTVTFHSDTICRSPVFHPEEWMGPNGERFGNAAAAGAILGVSGEYFEYIRRRYEQRSPSRPPEPIGIDLARRYMYWDLDEVEAFEGHRPGLAAAVDRLAELRRDRAEGTTEKLRQAADLPSDPAATAERRQPDEPVDPAIDQGSDAQEG